MSAWSTLLPLLAPLHLYSSIGGVDIYIKMVLSKICRSQYLNRGLDLPMHGYEVNIPSFILNFITLRNSPFWNFYFDLKYIPTLHFAHFLCSIVLILGLETLDNNITAPMMLLAGTMFLYTLTSFYLECRLQSKIRSRLNTNLETIDSILRKDNSNEHIQYTDLSQEKYIKVDKALFPKNYREERDTVFYRLHLTIVAVLMIYCIRTPLFVTLIIFPYIALFFLPKTDWYAQKINSSFYLNRYVHLTIISVLFLYLFATTDTPHYFPNILFHPYQLLLFFTPYFLIPIIIRKKVTNFNDALNNYTTIVTQYLSQGSGNNSAYDTDTNLPPKTQIADNTSTPKQPKRKKRKRKRK